MNITAKERARGVVHGSADCIRSSTALLRQGNDKPDVLLQGLTW